MDHKVQMEDVMNPKVVNEIPEGAVRIHLYKVEDVLRPRGPMEKESVGLYIKDKLEGAFESWTDSQYGDRIDPVILLHLLHQNLMEEANAAFGQMLGELGKTDQATVKEFVESTIS